MAHWGNVFISEIRLVPDLPAKAPEGRTNAERKGAGPCFHRVQRLAGKRGSGGGIWHFAGSAGHCCVKAEQGLEPPDH